MQEPNAFAPRGGRMLVLALTVGALSSLALLLPAAADAAAGIREAPRVLYGEDFEHEMGRTPVLLTKYQGAPPLSMTYGADQRFLENCNGFIVEFDSNERLQKTDCAEVAFQRVRQMAWVLGQLRGSDPLANHAVSAYTDGQQTLPANAVQFETLRPIPVAANGRFITFSVDAAETNCHRNHAKLKFFLVDGPLEIPTFTSAIEVCTDKRARVIKPPPLGTTAAEPFLAGTFAGNAATLFTGASLGIRMRNGQTSETGNDAAFDNIRVLDATPQLEKSFSPQVLSVGGLSQLTYTITNTAELAAKEGWSFVDSLPPGLVLASPARASTTCAPSTTITASAGGGSIAVTGNLAAEMSYCTVEVYVTSGREGTYLNGPGNVAETGLEPPGEAAVEFADNADLEIEKSVAPIPGRRGGKATFTLTVTNHGPDTARDVQVRDPIPAGLELLSAKGPCAKAGAEVRCALGSLAKGDSVTLELVVGVPESAADGFVNTATVTAGTPDPDPTNNSATAALPLSPEADLKVEKTVRPQRLTAGGQVTYLVAVRNAGPSAATDVTVTDPVPRALRLLAAHPSQGRCGLAVGLRCRLGRIAPGGAAVITVIAQVAPDAGGAVVNTVSVSGGEIDPHLDDNSSSARIEVDPLTPQVLSSATVPRLRRATQPQADLALTKRVDRSIARVGQRLTYTLRIANHGPDDAAAVHLVDAWTLSTRIVSVRPSRGHCGHGAPLRCSLGTIRPGGSAAIIVVARALRPGRERNTASAASAGRDPNLRNNSASAEAAIRQPRRPPPTPVVTG